jgi:hypothetical protein
MLITKTMLKRMKACKPQYDLFVEMFPNGAEWNDKETLKKAYGILDLVWFVHEAHALGMISDEHHDNFSSERERLIGDRAQRIKKAAQDYHDLTEGPKRTIDNAKKYINQFARPEDVIASGKLFVLMGEEIKKAGEKQNADLDRANNDYDSAVIDLYYSIPLRSFPAKKKS